MRSFFRYLPTESSDTVTVHRAAAVDASTAYGCVDWFIYPESKSAHV